MSGLEQVPEAREPGLEGEIYRLRRQLNDEVATAGYARIGVGVEQITRWLAAKELMREGVIDLLRLPSGALIAVRPQIGMATRIAALGPSEGAA